jgi:predicted O-methyltransferase YrrM
VSLVFRAPQEAIDAAVEKLKSDGVVHPDAAFNPNAPGSLRREIAYYDRDFIRRLGRVSSDSETVDSALAMLREHCLVDPAASYDEKAFEKHRAQVREKFTGSWTSLTPVMERLIYMLTDVRRPMHLLELGSFWGYTLAWFAGPCVGPNATYQAQRIVGIDVNAEATKQAAVNFSKLGQSETVQLVAADARTALERISGPFDFVYIEAKSDDEAKSDYDYGLYLSLLKQIYDRLAPGAWVIAHDSLDWTFTTEIAEYLQFVRDEEHFSQSVSFEIDNCGLELSIR